MTTATPPARRAAAGVRRWAQARVREDEILRYLPDRRDFIDEDAIRSHLAAARPPGSARLRDILARSAAIETLSPEDTAALLAVRDPDQVAAMEATAARVKRTVYDNRIVTFAPLYIGNRCVNNCLYCGFRAGNAGMDRRVLDDEAIRAEIRALAGEIGHKRLIVVYGEHPSTDAAFIARTMRTIYDVKAPVRGGRVGQIRRVNVNAAPMSIEDLRAIREAGLGTYQVFQETYHHATYARLHPAGTPKSDYAWRVTCMHRAFDAGIDDVGIGVLFGLADWRFEVMGLLSHAIELERRFGIGPHTISFPRLEAAQNAPAAGEEAQRVSDEDFRRALVVLRLAVPYTGMILTARETAAARRALIPLGITQTDASTRIGLGAYSERGSAQAEDRQQFMLGDTRSLDEVIRDLAAMGMITSFCTAGYRCGRTGDKIMGLLKSGREGHFCKLNAVLTFREWLDDFGSTDTRAVGEALIAREIEEIRARLPAGLSATFLDFYARTTTGERDLYI